MATIPIEITIQDQASPITPTPSTSTETNITVPDTGAGTIGNNTFSSSSVASIIVPAVLLVLSLATVCTFLIHRHRKQQNTKVSRKEKLAVSASATIAVLAAIVLIGNLVIPATKAATSDIIDGITPSEDKVSITVTRDGGVAEASIESTATITSTSDFGYKVLLSMAEGVDTSNLYLNGDEASEHYIAATESTELTDNTWGYALTEDGEYSAIPLLDNAIVVVQGDEPVEDEVLSIYYGVKVSGDLPAGTYSGGEIEYNFVTLEPSNISELTYMQDFAKLSESGKASVLRSMTEGEQYQLKDSRDNKTYSLAKLQDGNIWMTQNLDLQKEDLLAGTILDNTNTDNPTIGFLLPDSQTGGDDKWYDRDNEEASINTVHIYDLNGNSETYYSCLEYRPWGSCATYSETPIPPEDLGNLYNWYSATAGTGTHSLVANDMATGSICPAGWRLPTGTSDPNTITDFSNLLYVYGILNGATAGSAYDNTKILYIFDSPLKFARVGRYQNRLSYVGEQSSVWSSTAYSNNCASYLQFSANSFNTFYSGGQKSDGYSMRCIIK